MPIIISVIFVCCQIATTNTLKKCGSPVGLAWVLCQQMPENRVYKKHKKWKQPY
jgi:hypothetical protein